ncbi:zinc ABC transporter substrate-binding protein [Patescibacteria group bacterium]|nr:zinc ABC transporter substrate-binding protein [Patescibacteria group bacterium]
MLTSKKGGLILIFCLLALGLAGLWLWTKKAQELNGGSEKVQVVASIYPLAEVATRVGGDLVDVVTLTPPGVEPHEFQPTPQDLTKLYQADLVLLNGLGVDAWADKLVPELQTKGIRVLRLSDVVSVIENDPHLWLDPDKVKQEAEFIARELILLTNAESTIQEREGVFVGELSRLDEEYRLGLARCERREIVTAHDAFRYLASRYELTVLPIQGLSPESDPSLQTMSEITDLSKQKGIKYIFFESLIDPKLAETIAREIGAETLILHPLEGLSQEEMRSGKSYLSLMRDNLRNLRLALNCT